MNGSSFNIVMAFCIVAIVTKGESSVSDDTMDNCKDVMSEIDETLEELYSESSINRTSKWKQLLQKVKRCLPANFAAEFGGCNTNVDDGQPLWSAFLMLGAMIMSVFVLMCFCHFCFRPYMERNVGDAA